MTQPRRENGDWPAANAPIWLRQIAILRHCIGEEAVEILDQFDFDGTADPAEDGNRLPDVLQKFEGYFNPRRNLLYEWYVFMSMTISDGNRLTCLSRDLRHRLTNVNLQDYRI